MGKAILTANSISWISNDGQVFVTSSDHDDFKEIKNAIVNNAADDVIVDYFRNSQESLKRFVEQNTNGFCYQDDKIFYNGKELRGVIVKYMLSLYKANKPLDIVEDFVRNLDLNESENSKNELYAFLEKNKMPLIEGGYFVAYKKIKDNYYDCHTGTILNKPGMTITMDRAKVCGDKNTDCASGLHVSNYKYASCFSTGRMIAVKVNPKDVVSVPASCDCEKMRVCEYYIVNEIVNEIKNGVALKQELAPIDKNKFDNGSGVVDKNGTPWEEWEVKYLKKNVKKISNDKIALKLGRSKDAVRKKLERLNNEVWR